MTKREFEEFIDRCDRHLIYTDRYGSDRRTAKPICGAIWYSSFNAYQSRRIKKVLAELFSSSLEDHWFGRYYTDEEQATRHIALRLFEEYCISEKLYKGF